MHYEKLYKRTATGAIQVWWQERSEGRYRTHSGQKDGQIVSSEWTVAKAKNVGRSNETSPEQQAESEIESNYTLKKKSGYRVTVSDAETSERFSPMLAKVYSDYAEDVEEIFRAGETVLVQPKLDGIRCIATKDGLWSRQGNPIVAVPHIYQALQPVFQDDPGAIFDGELYNHELKADFPRLVSLIKKQKPTEEDLAASRNMVQYWIYDSPRGMTKTSERVGLVHDVALTVGPPLVPVPTHTVTGTLDIDDLHGLYLQEGFEGTMIRLEGPYETKRSKLLLKHKDFMDSEFRVADIFEGEGNRSGMAGYAVLLLPDGRTFRANIKGERGYLRQILIGKDSYVGKDATVEFFHLTPDGVPRFPRVKSFHKENRW
jgi:DNA ligase 1